MSQKKLPTRIGGQDLFEFVEKVTYHPGSTEKEIKKRIDKPREISSLIRTGELLNLIEVTEGNYNPTELGKELVYADDKKKKDILLRDIILEFDLYSIPIDKLINKKSPPFQLVQRDFQKKWSINFDLNQSKDYMDRAANTLFKLLETAGIGEYIIGRKGNPTRLEISENDFDSLQKAIEEKKQEKRKRQEPVEESDSEKERKKEKEAEPEGSQRESISKEKPVIPEEKAGYEVHKSGDGSVVLYIKPSQKSLKYLNKLSDLLEMGIEEDISKEENKVIEKNGEDDGREGNT